MFKYIGSIHTAIRLVLIYGRQATDCCVHTYNTYDRLLSTKENAICFVAHVSFIRKYFVRLSYFKTSIIDCYDVFEWKNCFERKAYENSGSRISCRPKKPPNGFRGQDTFRSNDHFRRNSSDRRVTNISWFSIVSNRFVTSETFRASKGVVVGPNSFANFPTARKNLTSFFVSRNTLSQQQIQDAFFVRGP